MRQDHEDASVNSIEIARRTKDELEMHILEGETIGYDNGQVTRTTYITRKATVTI